MVLVGGDKEWEIADGRRLVVDLGFYWVGGSHQTQSLTPDPSSTQVDAFRWVMAQNPCVLSLRSTPVVVDQHAGVDQWRETVDRRPGQRLIVQNPRHGKKKEEEGRTQTHAFFNQNPIRFEMRQRENKPITDE
ncbi:hypothetical protein Q3G72_013913 [Acer saccharum]|nr:hypothetical protein Q3G72_013913 [Acer saccharum]